MTMPVTNLSCTYVTSVSALQETLVVRATNWKGQPNEKVVVMESDFPEYQSAVYTT